MIDNHDLRCARGWLARASDPRCAYFAGREADRG